ncbi:MAG: hypothetical protein IIB38_05610 [Candidatus Hydrogenedentes bacterium]|nr:hypothetical protein [Candidatus Hydrogenedentota bacterium]
MRLRRSLLQGILGCFVMVVCCLSAIAQETDELEQLKESLKREILREMIEDSKSRMSSDDMQALKEQIKREILEELRQQEGIGAPLHEESPVNVENETSEPGSNVSNQPKIHPQGVPQPIFERGHAEGYILRGDRGLAGCTVKLLRIDRPGRRRGYQEEVEFQTVTSADGSYRFENIPEGKYALKWQLPGEKGWIRRLHKKADVTVEPGRTHALKPIDMSRGLVPR